ncbi:hypothetical protein LWI29_031525 [Acer saccharum]|uniref:Uncharacterized protein n=1 Tax=Acer saccharum TaxID=4024 RepID=A0AA39S508_ACESA|nr:hypothetical protein LWI29_031525 [Acer saccharum]
MMCYFLFLSSTPLILVSSLASRAARGTSYYICEGVGTAAEAVMASAGSSRGGGEEAEAEADATDRFKEGPFGQYLEMIQPIRVHGMLIYNLLKRQLICLEEEKDDEMWFGLGEKKARFGREEFCLCSGLNMGTLPEGFQEKEEVSEESILTRYFVDENPSIELLEAPLTADRAFKGDEH